MISSSTDDGTPIRCPVCGGTALVNVSRPPGDAVCPHCGTLLWVEAVAEFTREHAFVPDVRITRLEATTRDDAIREMTTAAASQLGWSPPQVAAVTTALLQREELGSTAIGNGFAVPHAAQGWIAKCTSILACAPAGLEFGALDKQPVHTVVLFVSPTSKPHEKLRMLEQIARGLPGLCGSAH